MIKLLAAYVATAAAFLILDMAWLTTMGQSFYRERLDGLLADKPNLLVGGLFYLVYVFGIVQLAIAPALERVDWVRALTAALTLGVVAYGTYDFTNLSTLKNWSWQVSVVDLAWGTFATATAALTGLLAAAWMP